MKGVWSTSAHEVGGWIRCFTTTQPSSAHFSPFLFRYNSLAHPLNLPAACSGVISLCGSASNSYPTKNFLTVALRSSGG